VSGDGFATVVVPHRSGYLDAEELGVLFKNMRMPMGQRELDDIVDEIDVDGNGEIDFEEFLLVIKNMQNPGADSASKLNLNRRRRRRDHASVYASREEYRRAGARASASTRAASV
jgi:hypothetical protein